MGGRISTVKQLMQMVKSLENQDINHGNDEAEEYIEWALDQSIIFYIHRNIVLIHANPHFYK